MDLLFRGFFGEHNLDRVLVRGLDAGSRDFTLRWTNVTLTQSACPRGAMDSILAAMTTNRGGSGNHGGGRPSERLARALAKAEIYVKAVTLRHLGGCLAAQHGGLGLDGSETNNVPQIRNPLHMLNVTAGELLRHRVTRARAPQPSRSRRLATLGRIKASSTRLIPPLIAGLQHI